MHFPSCAPFVLVRFYTTYSYHTCTASSLVYTQQKWMLNMWPSYDFYLLFRLIYLAISNVKFSLLITVLCRGGAVATIWWLVLLFVPGYGITTFKGTHRSFIHRHVVQNQMSPKLISKPLQMTWNEYEWFRQHTCMHTESVLNKNGPFNTLSAYIYYPNHSYSFHVICSGLEIHFGDIWFWTPCRRKRTCEAL